MEPEVSRSERFAFRALCGYAFAAALVLTLVMALLPHPPELPIALSDKVQHAAAFAVLAALAAGAWPGRLRQIALALVILGGFIEILQMIPLLHRDAEFADWATDVAATLAALLVVRMIQGKRASAVGAGPGDALC